MAQDLGAIDAQQINTMKMGQDIEIRVGRYGAYIQQGEGDARKYANIPENMAPDELTLAIAIELLAKPSGRSLDALVLTSHKYSLSQRWLLIRRLVN